MEHAISGLFASGGTALYDAIDHAYQDLLTHPQAEKISAIVVLSDGEDTNSTLKLPDLLPRIKFDNEMRTIRVFTIGYGAGARKEVLGKIADETQARYYKGATDDIVKVFKDISTFF